MTYQNQDVARVAEVLMARISEGRALLRSAELKGLFDQIKLVAPEERSSFGQEINQLRAEITALIEDAESIGQEPVTPIDVTAPFDINTPKDKRPRLLQSDLGSKHPLMTELEKVLDIFYRMGFTAIESRQIDDDYHMFGSINFPEGHPARDDYDTFMTTEKDENGKQFIAPAHTSTMQNRVLK